MNEDNNLILENTDYWLKKIARGMRSRAARGKEFSFALPDMDTAVKDVLFMHYYELSALLLAELAEEKARNKKHLAGVSKRIEKRSHE